MGRPASISSSRAAELFQDPEGTAVEAPWRTPSSIISAPASHSQATDRPVSLSRGQNASSIPFVLDVGGTITSSIGGTAGKPIANASVLANPSVTLSPNAVSPPLPPSRGGSCTRNWLDRSEHHQHRGRRRGFLRRRFHGGCDADSSMCGRRVQSPTLHPALARHKLASCLSLITLTNARLQWYF